MPLRETDALLRETVDVRRFHWPPVTAERREADIVEDDVHHARRPVRCFGRLERGPVGLRVADVDVDDALKRLAHRRSFRSKAWLKARTALEGASRRELPEASPLQDEPGPHVSWCRRYATAARLLAPRRPCRRRTALRRIEHVAQPVAHEVDQDDHHHRDQSWEASADLK